MNHMTADNLRASFGGESRAHMRYRIWASRAEKKASPRWHDCLIAHPMRNKYMQRCILTH